VPASEALSTRHTSHVTRHASLWLCLDPKPLRKKAKKVKVNTQAVGDAAPTANVSCWQSKKGKVAADAVIPHTYNSKTDEFNQQPRARPDDFDPYAGVNRKVCDVCWTNCWACAR